MCIVAQLLAPPAPVRRARPPPSRLWHPHTLPAGTSPLYVFGAVYPNGAPADERVVYGVFSTLFWTITSIGELTAQQAQRWQRCRRLRGLQPSPACLLEPALAPRVSLPQACLPAVGPQLQSLRGAMHAYAVCLT